MSAQPCRRRAGPSARGIVMGHARPAPKPLFWRSGSAVVGAAAPARPPWVPRAWRVPHGWRVPEAQRDVLADRWPVPWDKKNWVDTWARGARPPPGGAWMWMRAETDVGGELRALVVEWGSPWVTQGRVRYVRHRGLERTVETSWILVHESVQWQ